MQTALIRPTTTASTPTGPRVVETCRGTAHPEHERTRELVRQSLLLRAERMSNARD